MLNGRALNKVKPAYPAAAREAGASGTVEVRVVFDETGKVIWAKAISGPTSPPGKYPQLINAPGSETGPGPQVVTWGKSTILSVDAHGFQFEYTLNSAKHIPFDWLGP